ncbi:uncharacterized protein RJT21DRAFT_115832 [Scheffersomyces amazonensis]|uniref:uncharacterized protein n=1 Tax=Scheffersomyces amazonensis TaxID=1078765 RepID=UPI00315C9EDB
MSESTPTPATGAVKPKFDQEELIKLVKTPDFIRFIGQFITLISVILYSLTYIRIGTSWYWIWYQLSLLGVIGSLSVVLLEDIKVKGFNFVSLIKDDNVHYALLAGLLLFIRAYVLLTLIPFGIFALFNVLSYTKGYLLPVFGLNNSSPITKTVDNIVTNYGPKSAQLISITEIYTYGWLIIRMITFRKRSLSPVLVYTVFLKKRFETSHITRNYFKTLEVQGDKLINQVNHPTVKQIWVQFKDILRKVGGIYLVNDYTKEPEKTL